MLNYEYVEQLTLMLFCIHDERIVRDTWNEYFIYKYIKCIAYTLYIYLCEAIFGWSYFFLFFILVHIELFYFIINKKNCVSEFGVNRINHSNHFRKECIVSTPIGSLKLDLKKRGNV